MKLEISGVGNSFLTIWVAYCIYNALSGFIWQIVVFKFVATPVRQKKNKSIAVILFL
jgi:hypothetical protein